MNNFFSKSTNSAKLVFSLVAVAALAACGGGSDPAIISLNDLPAVAITPSTAPVANAALTAVSTGFSFPTGVPVLGTTAPTTVKFTSPAAGATATTPTFAITSGTGTATGLTTYGSCIFNVTGSTIPSIVAPATITVNPCSFDVNTTGKTVQEGATATVNATSVLVLGTTSSSPASVVVTVTNSGGVNTVTVNGASLGTVTGTVVTGATGGSN